jgi:DNA replication protein DnaC
MSLFYERIRLAKTPNETILTPIVLGRAGIGESYWDASLDAIPDRFLYKDTVAGYIMKMHEFEPWGYGLVLSGPFGTGKSALGSIILKEGLMRRGRAYSVRCSTMVDLMWSKKRGGEELPNGCPFLEGLENVSFLLLDDFEIFDSKAKNRAVEQVLYARYERRLPTIIATNLGWERLLEVTYLKSLLMDRYWPVEVSGINWREKAPTP